MLYCVFRMFRRRPTCLLRNTLFLETREELCLVMKEQGLGKIIFQFSVVILFLQYSDFVQVLDL